MNKIETDTQAQAGCAASSLAPCSPIRVQLSRRRGWRKPPNCIVVARPTRWGNPYKIGDEIPGLKGTKMDREDAVHWFAILHAPTLPVEEIRGKHLACWCPLEQPCHADVLLRLANVKAEPRPL